MTDHNWLKYSKPSSLINAFQSISLIRPYGGHDFIQLANAGTLLRIPRLRFFAGQHRANDLRAVIHD
jgi:hypothetical protein